MIIQYTKLNIKEEIKSLKKALNKILKSKKDCKKFIEEVHKR